jgi:hypothetical protein
MQVKDRYFREKYSRCSLWKIKGLIFSSECDSYHSVYSEERCRFRRDHLQLAGVLPLLLNSVDDSATKQFIEQLRTIQQTMTKMLRKYSVLLVLLQTSGILSIDFRHSIRSFS